ncbi:MAG: 4-hydroxyphenylpyruvate dioxygenase [Propionibacteriaceae bacterium]|nr:4-hydroxyphenylpyruvate dioxygenase [Propionibacteriaceae bacterium]
MTTFATRPAAPPTDTARTPAQRLLGWDHIELWVGNARATAGFLMSAFGFRSIAYAGPETGRRDSVSHVLEQGNIRLVITGGLSADSPITRHVARHGDGVHDLAWRVDGAATAYELATARGARTIREPWVERDDRGVLRLATVGTYGETQHTFVDRSDYPGRILAPGYSAADRLPEPVGPDVGLTHIDHVVGNVEKGQLAHWVEFYEQVMGFAQLTHFDADQISTQYSALMSTVVWDGNDIVMPINEPADGLRKSQIQEYIEAYAGPGVQHVALATDDIVTTVQALRERGVRFMTVPETYYADAQRRLADVDLPWAELERLNILVDRDERGYLLQIFTETVMDRPTVFFEIIQRHGATGFGEGNFKALFEAIERDQARRGNL